MKLKQEHLFDIKVEKRYELNYPQYPQTARTQYSRILVDKQQEQDKIKKESQLQKTDFFKESQKQLENKVFTFSRLFLYASNFTDNNFQKFEYSDMIILPRSVLNEFTYKEQLEYELLVQNKSLILEIKPLNSYLNSQLPFKLKSQKVERTQFGQRSTRLLNSQSQGTLQNLPQKQILHIDQSNQKYLPNSLVKKNISTTLLRRQRTRLIVNDQSSYEPQSMLYSQSQLCWVGGFSDKQVQDSIKMPKWLQNVSMIAENAGVFVRRLSQQEVNEIFFAEAIKLRPISPNCQIIANSIDQKSLQSMLIGSIKNFKLLWLGKILKCQIKCNMYLYEIEEINQSQTAPERIQVYYNEVQSLQVLPFSKKRYEEQKSHDFNLYETYDFRFMEMKNIAKTMDADEVLNTKGLDLEEIQIHEKNNQLLLQIQKQLRELNIGDQHNSLRMKKSHSEKFFDGNEIANLNPKKSHLMLKFLLQQQHNYEKKQFQKKLDRQKLEQEQQVHQQLTSKYDAIRDMILNNQDISQGNEDNLTRQDMQKRYLDKIQQNQSKKLTSSNQSNNKQRDQNVKSQLRLEIQAKYYFKPPRTQEQQAINQDLNIVQTPILLKDQESFRQSIYIDKLDLEINTDIQSNDSQILKPNYNQSQEQTQKMIRQPAIVKSKFIKSNSKDKTKIPLSHSQNQNVQSQQSLTRNQESQIILSNNQSPVQFTEQPYQPFVKIEQVRVSQEDSINYSSHKQDSQQRSREHNSMRFDYQRRSNTAQEVQRKSSPFKDYIEDNFKVILDKQEVPVLDQNQHDSSIIQQQKNQSKLQVQLQNSDYDDEEDSEIIMHQLPLIKSPSDYQIALQNGFYQPFQSRKLTKFDQKDLVNKEKCLKKQEKQNDEVQKHCLQFYKTEKFWKNKLVSPSSTKDKHVQGKSGMLKIIGKQTASKYELDQRNAQTSTSSNYFKQFELLPRIRKA